MWIIQRELTKKEQARQLEEMDRAMKEAQERKQRQEAWLERHTCPHCKRHPPIPPHLQ